MDTAPQDGTPVLGYVPSYFRGTGGICVILWLDGAWYDNTAFATRPTHWMALPEPPAA